MDNFSHCISGVVDTTTAPWTKELLAPKPIETEKVVEMDGFWFKGQPAIFSTFLEGLARKNNVSFYYIHYKQSGFFFKTYEGEFVVRGKQSDINAFVRDFNEITTL